MPVAARVLAAPFRNYVVALLPWTLAAAIYGAAVMTFERAPVIHVRWAASVDRDARVGLEKRFALSGGRHDTGQTWFYFLSQPSAGNIEALVTSPAVDDTHHLDRLRFRLSPSAERRGPYISTGSAPRWLPAVVLDLVAGLVMAGAWALGVAVAPVLVRLPHLRVAKQFVGALRDPATWTLLAMCAGLLLIWMPYVRHLRMGADESLPFRIGDWLVSYEAGFVRRGLPGSPILALTTRLAVPPEQVVFWIQAVLYTLLSCLLVILARGKRLNVWFLAFLFSPAGLLFALYDPAVAGRKDLVFFVVFALYACWMPRPERRWTRVAAFALGAATTLTHELFFFYTPYLFLMRLLRSDGAITPSRFAPELSLFGGSLVALLLASTVGENLRGEAQCALLLARGFNEQLCDGILRYPLVTMRDGAEAVVISVQRLDYLPFYLAALALAALPLLPLLGLMKRPPRWLLPGIAAAFAFTLPMFAIALDWGRLINIHVMALSVLILAFVLEDRSVPGSIFGVRNRWLRIATLAAVFLYLSAWSIRHCCADAFSAGLFA